MVGFAREILEAHRERLRVRDLDLAAYLIVSAAEGVGLDADPERFDERTVPELVAMFSRYLVAGT